MEVLNGLGHGLLEKPYENALVVEFGLQGIPVRQQPRYEVRYKGVVVGDYVPDLIVCDRIVVDAKVIEQSIGSPRVADEGTRRNVSSPIETFRRASTTTRRKHWISGS